jgi:hypothetical protein
MALCFASLAAAWYFLWFRSGITFWSSHDDYSYLSLSHALSFEHFLTGGGYTTNGGLAGHPGVPFHLASWLAWKLAFPSGAETFASVLAGNDALADRFGVAASIIALALTFVGVGLVFLAARGNSPLVPLVATLAYFAFSPEAWTAAFRLGIESFSLAIAAMFYIAARRAFSNTSTSRDILLLGVVGGFAYTLKLHYIVFFVAGGVGLLVSAICGRFVSLRQTVLAYVGYAAGFLLGFLPLMLMVAGTYALERLLKFHLSVFLHSGHYGEGEATIVASASLLRSLDQLANAPSTVAVSVILATITAVAVLRMSKQTTIDGRLSLIVALTVAFVLSFLSVLKHFQIHYLVVPAAVAVPILMYAQQELLSRQRWAGALLCVVLSSICVLVTVPAFIRDQQTLKTRAAAVADDMVVIDQLTKGRDGLRVWDYRVPAQGFAAGFVVAYAGSARVTAWYESASLKDRNFDILSQRPWRFAVVERYRYQSEQDLRERWAGIQSTDRVQLLKALILIERQGWQP